MRRLCAITFITMVAVLLFEACLYSQETGLQAIGPDSDCFSCHQDRSLIKELPGGRKISLYIDKNAWQRSAHANMGCVICHGENPHPPTEQVDSLADWQQFETSLQEACGGCHLDQQTAFSGSVHATSENPNAPSTCTGCHDPHAAGIATGTKQGSVKLCGRCHAYARQTYFRSIHGQNLALGNNEVAACYDCHGYHDVRADFTSKELASVCSKCHKGVTPGKVSGFFSHTPVTSFQNFVLDSAKLFYIIIIPLTIASMIAHQILRHRRTMERRRRQQQEGNE